MKPYEYRVFRTEIEIKRDTDEYIDKALTEWANLLGSDCWEIVNIKGSASNVSEDYVFFGDKTSKLYVVKIYAFAKRAMTP